MSAVLLILLPVVLLYRTGLLAVMGTEGIDGCKTTSNDVMEVQRTLGIEAARVCIIEEIKKVMKSHGMNIDDRHMIFLADVMTYRVNSFDTKSFTGNLKSKIGVH